MAKVKKKTAAKAKKKVKKTAAKKLPAKKSAVQLRSTKNVSKKRAPKIVISKAAERVKGLPEHMLAAALRVLDERKAEQIITVSLAGRSALADYMIIASGRASRQVVALADHLREAFLKLGVRAVRIEGQQDANWVLVDAGDVIVHLFLPEVRKYYDLDTLWSKRASKR